MQKIKYNALWVLQHFSPTKRLESFFDSKREKLLSTNTTEQDSANKVEILELTDASNQEIYRLIQSNTPFIYRGFASDWPCVKMWTPDMFESELGDDEIHIFDKNNYQQVQTTTLREIARGIKKGGQDYARFTSLLHQHPKLKKDFDIKKITALRGGKKTSSYQFFLGAKGSETPLHAASTGNLFCQIYGRKKWVMITTDYSHYVKPVVNRTPYFQSMLDVAGGEHKNFPLKYLEFEIGPGDLLYTPSFYWHQVENLSDSMGMAFRWINLSSAIKSSPTMLLLNLFANNPSVLASLKLKQEFTRVFGMTKYGE